ncbi:chromosome alignment-maintaining phosphoprotein 1 [Pelobates fuscus]|uniref:chromosome alignment-maintaining phosphoprotein 1 n=1 Tax=Pelobates fuscus TaxID=191477 RepID=UPI002FE47939
MEVMQKPNAQCLDCNRCNFRANDSESIQIHIGTIHPELCDEMDTGGLGKLVFYQKSARLFHCHRCFFTSKMFCNVYYHILAQHSPDKWISEDKDMAETKSEPSSVKDSVKNDSESGTSEDEKPPDEEKIKLTEVIKADENDTLTSWPEKVPNLDNQENLDTEFKNGTIEKASAESPDIKKKESSIDRDMLESESSSISSTLSKANSVHVVFSERNVLASQIKDIPEFSSDDESPALPDGIPHFSEDEETITQTKELEELSGDEALLDHNKGIEDISEDEMPKEENVIDDVSEDEAPVQSKGLADSFEEEEAASKAKVVMEFSEEEEEETPALSKEIMEFSEEDEEEPINVAKNIMEFSEEEDTTEVSKNIMEFSEEEETTEVSKNIMEFSEEEETTEATKNIMEFSEEEDAPALSKDIMEFSEEEETPSVSKGIMEFSEEEATSPQLKDMPKYFDGNSTPTQSKDTEYVDIDTSASKISALSGEESSAEGLSAESKDLRDISKSENTPIRLAGVPPLPEYVAPSWSKELLDSSDGGDISTVTQDTSDSLDDHLVKEEEIMKNVRRVKGKFYCMLCECRPLKKGPIMHHLITRHQIPSPFVCKTCGKIFLLETHLKHHLSTHSKGLFKCSRCSFQTDHSRGFKKHQTHCQSRHKEDEDKTLLDFSEETKEEEEEEEELEEEEEEEEEEDD